MSGDASDRNWLRARLGDGAVARRSIDLAQRFWLPALVLVTSVAVGSVAYWLVIPYLLLMAGVLYLPARPLRLPRRAGRAAASSAARTDRAGRVDVAGSVESAPLADSLTLEVLPAAANVATATKPRRTRRKPKDAVATTTEVPTATWVQVGPGRFVRVEAAEPATEAAVDAESAIAEPPAIDQPSPEPDLVGWVERSEAHQVALGETAAQEPPPAEVPLSEITNAPDWWAAGETAIVSAAAFEPYTPSPVEPGEFESSPGAAIAPAASRDEAAALSVTEPDDRGDLASTTDDAHEPSDDSLAPEPGPAPCDAHAEDAAEPAVDETCDPELATAESTHAPAPSAQPELGAESSEHHAQGVARIEPAKPEDTESAAFDADERFNTPVESNELGESEHAEFPSCEGEAHESAIDHESHDPEQEDAEAQPPEHEDDQPRDSLDLPPHPAPGLNRTRGAIRGAGRTNLAVRAIEPVRGRRVRRGTGRHPRPRGFPFSRAPPLPTPCRIRASPCVEGRSSSRRLARRFRQPTQRECTVGSFPSAAVTPRPPTGGFRPSLARATSGESRCGLMRQRRVAGGNAPRHLPPHRTSITTTAGRLADASPGCPQPFARPPLVVSKHPRAVDAPERGRRRVPGFSRAACPTRAGSAWPHGERPAARVLTFS